LLQHGAAVDVRSASYDATPAQWAAHRVAHGPHPSIGDYSAVADLLEARGLGPGAWGLGPGEP
jgi:hypothetical protein